MGQIKKEKSYILSKHVRVHKLVDDNYIMWNRFFPNLLKLNKDAYLAIKNIEGRKITRKSAGNLANFIDDLLRYKLLYPGDTDYYQEEFFGLVDKMVEKSQRKATEFYEKKLAYAQLYIINLICNLNCSYCARKYNHYRSNRVVNVNRKKKEKLLHFVVDQYIERRIKNNIYTITISFNGGEILLEWPLIEALVLRNVDKYPDLKFKYFINTNMTSMTNEISRFISKHDFKLDISIDGYQEAHDRSRLYHNGKGSFGDIQNSLEIYNKHNEHKPITNFQGTIDNASLFSPEKVYEMKKLGFKSARLGPNLLNVCKEDALKKAEIFGKFLELNQYNDFEVSDSFFDNIRRIIRLKDYFFYFSCNGLGCLPRPGFNFDITSMTFSHICNYCPSAALPCEELDYDIYNPKLWDASYKFIKDRAESLKKNCSQCDLVGICKGDCIMLGLDSENKKNENACLFQKKIWEIFLNHLYLEQKEFNNNEMSGVQGQVKG